MTQFFELPFGRLSSNKGWRDIALNKPAVSPQVMGSFWAEEQITLPPGRQRFLGML